jgi:hypothetical protein
LEKNKDEIKIALMLKDLEYEFPHKEHMIDEAMRYNNRLKEVNEEDRNKLREDSLLNILNKNRADDD